MSNVRCPHCKAPENAPCVIVGTPGNKPLRLSTMHPSRAALLGEQPDYEAVNRYRKELEE